MKTKNKSKELFPYPLPETRGIGDVDPRDFRRINGEMVLDPGWWKKIDKKPRR